MSIADRALGPCVLRPAARAYRSPEPRRAWPTAHYAVKHLAAKRIHLRKSGACVRQWVLLASATPSQFSVSIPLARQSRLRQFNRPASFERILRIPKPRFSTCRLEITLSVHYFYCGISRCPIGKPDSVVRAMPIRTASPKSECGHVSTIHPEHAPYDHCAYSFGRHAGYGWPCKTGSSPFGQGA